ncbi:phosphotransferase [Solihabitans fulvus]|nr:phosphotransferase [Solihabitans fulvus]
MRSVACDHHLLASGQDADAFIRSDGLLVKRSRDGASLEREAELLRYLRTHDIPVPRVAGGSGPELVMEYVPGPTMAEELDRRPWRAAAIGRDLARLHRALDAVSPPDQLPLHANANHNANGNKNGLLHLDLHPGNVVLGPEGPVVVDWANAARGDRRIDAALSWLAMMIGRLRPLGTAVRWTLVRSFLSGVDRAVLQAMPAAAEIRLASHHRDQAEQDAVRRLLERCRQHS